MMIFPKRWRGMAMESTANSRAPVARLIPAMALCLALALASALATETTDDCHSQCDCQRSGVGIFVDCSNRNLTSFPIMPANISEQVLELDVSRNGLWRLSGSAQRLPLLRALSLADNALSALPSRWLRRLPALLRLDLSGNAYLGLSGLGAGALTYAPTLQLLNLSRCEGIDSLDDAEEVLVSQTLEVLDLSHCSLPEVTGKLLTGLPALRRLDLSFNELHLLHGLNSTTLQELYLMHTGLDSIHPAALLDLRSLIELDVSGNRGFAFPERGVLSPTLTVLRARFCDMRLHNLKSFPNLRFATLQHNKIQSVWNTSFSNIFLTELDLSNNNIHRIHPEAFRTLPLLERLSLANNKISAIEPDAFVNNELLVMVNLSRNPLSEFGLMQANKLATLDMSQCNVERLSADSLSGMPALHTLDLSSNRLEYVPDNLTSDSLQWLDLSYCRLVSISNDTFRRVPSLMELDLSGNRFTEPFRAQEFATNARLRALHLRDNPWRCDCASQTFQRFAEFTLAVDEKEVTERTRCASPQNLQDQSWLQACYDVWYPTLDERAPARRVGVAILAVVAVVGGCMVLLSAVRSAVKHHRKEQERRRQEEMERRLEERERELREQIRLELDDDDDSVYRGPRSRPHRTPSEITQPPTYEEALLLSRSQQDLLNERTAAVAAGAMGAVGAAAGAGGGRSGGTTPGASAAATPATCARHLIYEVDVEPAPKPRPAKPPRKSAVKWNSGERLHSSQGNIGSNRDGGGTSAGVIRHSAPNAGGIPEELLTAIAEAMADSGPAGGAAGGTSSASAIATATATPTAATLAVTAPSSLTSSAISSPARTPRPRRPRDTCSSDASGEDSDDQTGHR